MSYQPEHPPISMGDAGIYLYRELLRLADALDVMAVDGVTYKVLHIAPEKPRDGLVVFADGTNWNPGAGAGLYERAGGAWSKL